MGEVWEGHDETLGRDVAVKVISVLAGGGSRGGEVRARFLREARITAVLQHPNIVTLHDLGEAEGEEGATPFLVMELLRGEGLDAVLRRGPVGLAEAARWGAQVCEALGEAHGKGVLHRDVKPANVHVSPSGVVKVLDFGIARAADPSGSDERLTQTGFMVGTPQYMAPEHARGEPEPRSDLYAMGCVLFEMITGRLPFRAPNAMGHLAAHLTETPPVPSAVAPGRGIPGEWDAAVLRLLRKEPGERYGSAADVAAELRALEERGKAEKAEKAAPVPAYTPTAVSPVAPAPPPAPAPGPGPGPGPFRPVYLTTIPLPHPVIDVAFAPHGRSLCLTLAKGAALVTDLSGDPALWVDLPSGKASPPKAAFSPDGTRLVTAALDKTLRFWDIDTGEELRRVNQETEMGKPVFSPDGAVLATADIDALRLRDPGTGEALGTLPEVTYPIYDPAFSPDGARLAVPQGYVVSVLQMAGDERELLTIEIPGAATARCVAFSPDGTTLATSGSGKDVWLWSVSTGSELLRLRNRNATHHVAFSPRAGILATAGADGTARLWTTHGGEELLKIRHAKQVHRVAFSPDGSLLATASQDRTAQLWRLTA
jgi:WD40 repeat protein